jgi:hypothetical protein
MARILALLYTVLQATLHFIVLTGTEDSSGAEPKPWTNGQLLLSQPLQPDLPVLFMPS